MKCRQYIVNTKRYRLSIYAGSRETSCAVYTYTNVKERKILLSTTLHKDLEIELLHDLHKDLQLCHYTLYKFGKPQGEPQILVTGAAFPILCVMLICGEWVNLSPK